VRFRHAIVVMLAGLVLLLLPGAALGWANGPSGPDSLGTLDWVVVSGGDSAGRITGAVTGAGGEPQHLDVATTNGAGGYDSGVLADGSYIVHFQATDYLEQFYNGFDVPYGHGYNQYYAQATRVQVTAGQITSGIDGRLTLAAPRQDTVPPTTTIHGADDAWHSALVTLTLTAEDPGADASGIASTEYKLDEGAWTQGSIVTVPAPPETKVTHLVLYRSMDKAGNLEATQTCSVKIDTVQPVTSVQSNVQVNQGEQVTFKYRVSDSGPSGALGSPKAKVKIVIKTPGLKVMKRLSPGRQATNTLLHYTWKCSLKQGAYRFYVYAADQAGNAQAKVGSGKLTVK